MSANDQFNTMGRLPLRPLSLSDKDLAQTKELLIDNLGDDPSYHIYITDSKDRTRLIDLTNLYSENPNISGDNLTITIDGLIDPQKLKYIINFIYKRYLMPDNTNGFNPALDYDKIFDQDTKTVLLKDTGANIYLPISKADAVYDNNGITVQERLDNMTRIGFTTSYVRATTDHQSSFEFTYPFKDYSAGGNYIEVKIGSTYIDKARYEIIDNKSTDGHIYTATINFIDESIDIGRAVNFLFIYNSADVSNGNNLYLYGGNIANNSIPSGKIEKVSDSFTLPDSTCLASSKALYNLYKFCCKKLNIDPETSTPNIGDLKISSNRYVYSIQKDGETTIPYRKLAFNKDCDHDIIVYRNGIRQFESIDYSMDTINKTITTYVTTEQHERFVFEYLIAERK